MDEGAADLQVMIAMPSAQRLLSGLSPAELRSLTSTVYGGAKPGVAATFILQRAVEKLHESQQLRLHHHPRQPPSPEVDHLGVHKLPASPTPLCGLTPPSSPITTHTHNIPSLPPAIPFLPPANLSLPTPATSPPSHSAPGSNQTDARNATTILQQPTVRVISNDPAMVSDVGPGMIDAVLESGDRERKRSCENVSRTSEYVRVADVIIFWKGGEIPAHFKLRLFPWRATDANCACAICLEDLVDGCLVKQLPICRTCPTHTHQPPSTAFNTISV
jgi:hypothetical protein